MHPNAYKEMQRFRDKYLPDASTLKILDVGSRGSASATRALVYHDIEKGKNVDIVVGNPYKWDIPDETYDVVVSSQCFEHVEFPWCTMKEISRVLKTGGLVCIIAPSCGPEHRYPLDCYRYMPDGLKAIARINKIECLEVYLSSPSHRYLRSARESITQILRPKYSFWTDCVFIGMRI